MLYSQKKTLLEIKLHESLSKLGAHKLKKKKCRHQKHLVFYSLSEEELDAEVVEYKRMENNCAAFC